MSGAQSALLSKGWFERGAASGSNPSINSDGTITGGSGLSDHWFTPTTGAIGSSYWCKTTLIATINTGTDVSPASGTWRSLSAGIAFGVLSGVGGAQVFAQIAADAAGVSPVFAGVITARNDI